MIWKILTAVFFVLALHFGFIALSGKLTTIDCDGTITTYADKKEDNDPRPKFIIDTDAGSDDAVAILLALAAKDKIQIIGITCTYGNTNESNVETNVLKILTIANRTDVPVYAGAQLPLVQNYTQTDYFGKDGLGDFDFGMPVKGEVSRSKHAAMVMVELAQRYQGQLNILTLGPLTNLGLAVSLDSNFIDNVARFYVMGGWFPEDSEPHGNPEVEFNFGNDPEANDIFFKKPLDLKKPLTTLLPNNLVKKKAISMKWRTDVLGKLNSTVIEFLNKAERPTIDRLSHWESADAIMVAMAIWPDLVTDSLDAHLFAITCNAFMGAVIADRESSNKNIRLIQDFDVTRYQKILLQHLA